MNEYIRNLSPAAAVLGAQAAGIPALNIMTPNPMHSAFAGVAFGAPLLHTKGLHFAGMWGYRTLFTGVNSTVARLTVGNVALSTVEAVGKYLTGKGNYSKAAVWAANARELGLTSLMSASDKMLKEAEVLKLSRWGRILGGQGETYARITKPVLGEAGKRLGTMHFVKFDPGVYIAKFPFASTLGTVASAYAWWQVAKPAVNWLAENTLSRVSTAAGYLRQFLIDQRRSSFGAGYLAPSFQTQQAATERQRAVQAVYAARVNPSSRVFGNEARLYHR